VRFLNQDGDLLVGHGEQVSFISRQSYGLHSTQLRNPRQIKGEDKFIQNNQEPITDELMKMIKKRENVMKEGSEIDINDQKNLDALNDYTQRTKSSIDKQLRSSLGMERLR
jgi:hypothetical protein